MNDDARQQNGQAEPEDDLRRALAEEFGRSSERHDAAILAAARDASREIRTRRRRRRRSVWLLPAAAALAGVILLPLLYEPAPPEPVTRGQTEGVVPAHRATLDMPPSRFQWPAVTQARTYRVELLDAAAEPVWQSGETSAIHLDAAAAESAMRDDGSYLWVVTADTPDGTVELGPYWFRLER